MKYPKLSLLLLFVVCAWTLNAETVKDRQGALIRDRQNIENGGRWIYNDWEAGFAEAKRTGKPLLVVFRCVPCMACIGLDAQLLLEADHSPVMNEFVCVRVMNANALDLSLFQIDYDLSFSAMLFNADGTIYGRYGSWRHQRDPLDKTTAGFLATLQSVLALHRNYPANKAFLDGKRGDPAPYKRPVDIPGLKDKYDAELDWNANTVKSCVHCHQIGDAFRSIYRDKGQPIPTNLIYPWPAPEAVGMTLTADGTAVVQSVEPGSAAAKAGIKPGDEIFLMKGQPMVSEADVSWVLHRSPDEGAVAIVVRRGGKQVPITLKLEGDWRRKSDISRRVGTWPMRGLALGGMRLEELPDVERTQLKIADKAMALRVKAVGKYGKHAAAMKAGIREGDVLLSLDGHDASMGEGELIGHLLQSRHAGEQVDAVVLRDGGKLTFKLPVQ
jgi:serine protease Do